MDLTVDQALLLAVEAHQSGKLQDAERLYRVILEVQPKHPDANHNLGVLAVGFGKASDALPYLKTALEASPQQGQFWVSYVNALIEAKQIPEAKATFEEGMRLGLTGEPVKQLEQKFMELPCKEEPSQQEIDSLLSRYNSGNLSVAEYQAKELTIKFPNHPFGWKLLGAIFAQTGRLEESLLPKQESVLLAPNDAETHSNLGISLKNLGRLSEAEESYREAIRIKPDYAEAHSNLGNVLSDLGRLTEAEASCREAIRVKPSYSEAYNNLGNVLHKQGKLIEAEACYREATRFNPDYAEAHWNRSLLLILTGMYLEGWALYEWRLKKDDVKDSYYRFPQLAWRGQEDIRGKRLLIHTEQGLGDVIQFCRYLPQVHSLGAEIILEVPSSLVSFVSTLDCRMTVVAKGSVLPEFDAYCPIMSLPFVFKTTIETIPQKTPYLISDKHKVQQWQTKLGSKSKLRVGLVWSGNENQKKDRYRSIRLNDLLPLIDIQVEWHSLQKQYRQYDEEVLKHRPEIQQHQNDLNDFSDTAALIECLDLIVTVDTSVAHVAGAMGKPVWILLSLPTDYRWLLDREDSPWYPTAKLFRQSRIGDWASSIERVCQNLNEQIQRPLINQYPMISSRAKKIKVAKMAKLKAGLRTQAPSQHELNELIAGYNAGNFELAEQLAGDLTKKYPNHPFGWKVLGVIFKLGGRLEESLKSMQQSVRLAPNDAEAHSNFGNALRDLGRLLEAEASCRAAIRLKPDFAEAHNNLGNVVSDLGRLTEAEANYREVIRLKPDFAEAHSNLGVVLRDLGRLTEAEASCREAIRLKPSFAEAHNDLGNALRDLGRLTEAETNYREAIHLKPDLALAHSNIGNVLMLLGRLDESFESFVQAYSLKPELEFLFGQKLHAQMKLCDWTNIYSRLLQLVKDITNEKPAAVPFPLLGLIDDPAAQLQAAKICVDFKYPNKQSLKRFDRHQSNGKIRIGYFSADFYNHATAYLMAELFENHNSDRFEIHGFSFGPSVNDEMRKRVSSSFDGFHDVRGLPDQEIAKISRELGIDIAVDLKGFTTHARTGIFAERAAPIQVNYLGYPGTMAAPYIDYIIADKTVIPEESQVFYTEKVVYLPYSYQVNDSKRRISKRVLTRQDAGLPDDGFVFCCFNNNYKILPSTFDGWMRILKAVEGSVLWLFEDNPTAAKNLRKEADASGVDSSRLVFAQRMKLDEHLARHRLADLFLDTLPYNAHTTASDALWAGLPVLTCMGKSFASRVAASLLGAVGLPELITESQAEYEAKATELATSPSLLADIRAKLNQNRITSPLFNGRLFARHIEAAYVQMYQRYQSGLEPAQITISSDSFEERIL